MSWKKVKLGDIVTVSTGKYDVNHSVEDGEYPFYTCAMIPFRSRTYSFDDEVILLPGNGANVGEVMYYHGKLEAYQRTYVLHKINANVRYIYFFLRSCWKNVLQNQQYGSATNYIRLNNITDLQIPLPPLPIQKRIAEILDTADALKRKDEELLKKYDELAQAIFIDMFGDPVKNEKGWEVKELKDVVHPERIVTYGIVQAGEHIDNGIPYIRTGDIKNGEIQTAQLLRTTKEIANSYKRSEVNKGDIVMSIRATVGTVALLPDELDGANLTQGTARISPSDVVKKHYLFNYIKTDYVQRWIDSNTKGATFREITLTKLRELPVLVPPIEKQNEYEKSILNLTSQILINKNSITQTDILFNSLIQKAFKGELVKEEELV